MFGPFSIFDKQVKFDEKKDTIESLREELKDAKREIEKLKRALGPNHHLGYESGRLF